MSPSIAPPKVGDQVAAGTQKPLDATDEFTRHTGFLLAQLGRAITRRYRAALGPIGLKPRETAALMQLRKDGPTSQQDLGAALDIDPSNLVALLNSLESEGLVTRRRDPQDRRRHVVEISASGITLVGKVHCTAEAVEDKFFAALDPQERLQIRELFERVAESTDDFNVVPSEAEIAEA